MRGWELSVLKYGLLHCHVTTMCQTIIRPCHWRTLTIYHLEEFKPYLYLVSYYTVFAYLISMLSPFLKRPPQPPRLWKQLFLIQYLNLQDFGISKASLNQFFTGMPRLPMLIAGFFYALICIFLPIPLHITGNPALL